MMQKLLVAINIIKDILIIFGCGLEGIPSPYTDKYNFKDTP